MMMMLIRGASVLFTLTIIPASGALMESREASRDRSLAIKPHLTDTSDLTTTSSSSSSSSNRFTIRLSSKPKLCVAYLPSELGGGDDSDLLTLQNCRAGAFSTWWVRGGSDENDDSDDLLIRSYSNPDHCIAWSSNDADGDELLRVKPCDTADPFQQWVYSRNGKLRSHVHPHGRDCIHWCDTCPTYESLHVQICRKKWNEHQVFQLFYDTGDDGQLVALPELLGDPGSTCVGAAECQSGACAQKFSHHNMFRYSTMVCCSSSYAVLYGNEHYCASPNGQHCAVDEMCLSKFCNNNGICRTRPPSAVACEQDSDCDSDFCDNGVCLTTGGADHRRPSYEYVADFEKYGSFFLIVEADDSTMSWTATIRNMIDIDESITSLNYYLGVQWTTSDYEFGKGPQECSRSITGGQYDPHLACGPYSAAADTLACRDLERTDEFYYQYTCPGDDSSCGVGDLSGKFGPTRQGIRLSTKQGHGREIATDDPLAASNDDYESRTTFNSYRSFASVVFVDAKGTPLLCGKLHRVQ